MPRKPVGTAASGLLGWALACALGLSCSGRQAAPQAAEPAPAPAPSPAPEPAPAPDPSEAPPEAEPAPVPTAEAPPPPSLVDLCNQMCDAVAPKCNEMQLAGCRSTCQNYDSPPDACVPVVRAALECARADKDFLFCANVVPEACAKRFKAIDTCLATGKAPVDKERKGLPEGWARYSPAGVGFSVAMPKGVAETTEGAVKRWSSKAADGASYEVTQRPGPPDKKLDTRAFLRITRQIFPGCTAKMKLHSMIEKPGHTSMQYKSVCPDQTEIYGTLHVVGDRLLVLLLRFPRGQEAEIDPFVYSFQVSP